MRNKNSRRFAATSSLLAAVLVGLVAAATAIAAAPRTNSPPTIEGKVFRQGSTLATSNGYPLSTAATCKLSPKGALT